MGEWLLFVESFRVFSMKRKESDITSTRRRYERLSLVYDLVESPMEGLRFSEWRARLPERIQGKWVLEVGVGTGKNIPYYPKETEVCAIDVSPRMLRRAKKRAELLGRRVQFQEMDVQFLGFQDHSFDAVFATFVFCSVPDPVMGLRELRRVCKPDGRLILLEHMRPDKRVLGLLFDLLNPFVVRVMGANINRRTMDNIRNAGWQVSKEKHLSSDIVRWIEAKP
jgi:ubiquinone/menaquinone biosynthesis C-methylase UbiE